MYCSFSSSPACSGVFYPYRTLSTPRSLIFMRLNPLDVPKSSILHLLPYCQHAWRCGTAFNERLAEGFSTLSGPHISQKKKDEEAPPPPWNMTGMERDSLHGH